MRSTLAVAFILLASAAAAQKPHRPHPATQATPTSQLPITRVALYKNGVGFFEHSGRVTGDQAVTIDFTSAQLNDVLQSLTAIDLQGGRISGAGYNSTTPLDQQLKNLPLALGADASDLDFYNAIRGARVQVTGPGLSITGRLLSIDLREAALHKDTEGRDPVTEHRFMTVVSDSGQVRTFEVTGAVSVILLDTALHTDVTRYLEILAANRSQGLRHLTLTDRGTGTRDLRVSYISEVPVWKSTYRILFTDTIANGSATLQGWSVVDNTTGSDWTNIHLDLIAGAPQSFIQPLSTPYYTRRPEIPLPQEAQLEPQTHASGDSIPPPPPPPSPGMSEQVTVNAAPMALKARNVDGWSGGRAGGIASGFGRGQGVGGGVMGGNAGGGEVMGGFIGGGVRRLDSADYAQAAESSLIPQTTTAAYDDFFEYSLTDPITIRKNESALVPILQTRLPIERVTLWSPQQPQALRALWLTNNSTLTLDRGSFSIVENGNFGGEGLLDAIHPNERRLLSYAADQAVHVTESGRNSSRRVTNLKIARGVLTETATDVSELTYDIRNAAPDARTVVVEHPVRPGYTLDSVPRPDETTPTVDRFRVQAAPGATVHLHVGERHVDHQYIRLVDRTVEQIVLLIRNDKASPNVLAQLQPVFDAHAQVVALDAQITEHQQEINTITNDQNRLRENLKALKGTPEEKALATRYTGELNQQEDRLAALNQQITQLRTQRTTADLDFQNKLAAVNVDESL